MRSVEGPEEQARAMRGIKGGLIGLLIVVSAKGIVNYVVPGGLSGVEDFLGSEGARAVTNLFNLGIGVGGIICAAVLIYCGIEYVRRSKKKGRNPSAGVSRIPNRSARLPSPITGLGVGVLADSRPSCVRLLGPSLVPRHREHLPPLRPRPRRIPGAGAKRVPLELCLQVRVLEIRRGVPFHSGAAHPPAHRAWADGRALRPPLGIGGVGPRPLCERGAVGHLPSPCGLRQLPRHKRRGLVPHGDLTKGR